MPETKNYTDGFTPISSWSVADAMRRRNNPAWQSMSENQVDTVYRRLEDYYGRGYDRLCNIYSDIAESVATEFHQRDRETANVPAAVLDAAQPEHPAERAYLFAYDWPEMVAEIGDWSDLPQAIIDDLLAANEKRDPLEMALLNRLIHEAVQQHQPRLDTIYYDWTDSMHDEHFEVQVKGQSDNPEVPICPKCGNKSWMRITQKVEPYEKLLMCFGCCHIMEDKPVICVDAPSSVQQAGAAGP